MSGYETILDPDILKMDYSEIGTNTLYIDRYNISRIKVWE